MSHDVKNTEHSGKKSRSTSEKTDSHTNKMGRRELKHLILLEVMWAIEVTRHEEPRGLVKPTIGEFFTIGSCAAADGIKVWPPTVSVNVVMIMIHIGVFQ